MKTDANKFSGILPAAGVKRSCVIFDNSLTGLIAVIRRQAKGEWVHVHREELAFFAAGTTKTKLWP